MKPECIIEYNKRMRAVDKTDMLLSSVESVRRTTKWYKKSSVIKQCLEESEVVSGHEKLIKLCATRWTERYNSVAVFLELYVPVVLALETISEWTDKDSAGTANQLGASIKKPNLLFLWKLSIRYLTVVVFYARRSSNEILI